MYHILTRKSDEKLTVCATTNLANAIEYVDDMVMHILIYHRGAAEPYFLPDHPQSTIGTPSWYCIPDHSRQKYNIYHHTKTTGWFGSEHNYEKKYSIKIIRSAIDIDQFEPPRWTIGLATMDRIQHRAKFQPILDEIESKPIDMVQIPAGHLAL